MSREELIRKVLNATETEAAQIEKVFTGMADVPQDRRLLNYRQAADALGVSKTSIRRFVKDGRLVAVETRLGRKRVTSQSITAFATGTLKGNGND